MVVIQKMERALQEEAFSLVFIDAISFQPVFRNPVCGIVSVR